MNLKLYIVIFLLISLNNVNFAQNLQWVRSVGSTNHDASHSIAIDMYGNIYSTGYFRETADFNPGAGAFNLTSMAYEDIFIQKLDASGNFVWAKSMGSTGYDAGISIAVDNLGNVHTVGYFQGTVDFDPGASTFNLTSAGYEDIFIQKLDASGNFIWAKRIGSINYDIGQSIALDSLGNVYTTGFFQGTTDFDPGTGTFNLTSGGYEDIFIQKLDALGNFIWAKRIGSTSYDRGHSITVSTMGDVYTTGYFNGTIDFDPGPGTYNLSSAGSYDIFVQKMNSSGNFIWAKRMGSVESDAGWDIALDALGNSYITGNFKNTADFNPDSLSFNLTSVGDADIFIQKLDTAGNFVWAKSMGSAKYETGFSIAIDDSGNVYTTGDFSETTDFNPGAEGFNLTSTGGKDIFIQKLDASGNFIWAKKMGSLGDDGAFSIALSGSGIIYLTGSFSGTADFDPGEGIFNLSSTGSSDIFIAKMGLTTELTENILEGNLIYPNPTNGILAIELRNSHSDVEIEVMNSLGQIIQKVDCINRKMTQDIEINGAAGVYYIIIKNDKGQSKTEKIVKK